MTESGIINHKNFRQDSADITEYSLLISPGTEIQEKIKGIRENLQVKYRLKIQPAYEAYIPVAAFSSSACMEETLMRWIQRICCRKKSFPVMINNFSCSTRGELFLRVQNVLPFHNILDELKAVDDFISSPVKAIRHSGLCVAENIPMEIFREVMLDYSQKMFTACFTATQLILAKKTPGSELLKTMNVFHFLPVEKIVQEEYFATAINK